jgi:hypothetical protein
MRIAAMLAAMPTLSLGRIFPAALNPNAHLIR